MAKGLTEKLDVHEMVCGLVPAMIAHLKKTDFDVVEFTIRAGIQTEIRNGFGSGGDWDVHIETGVGGDVVRFIRKPEKQFSDVNLNLLDY